MDWRFSCRVLPCPPSCANTAGAAAATCLGLGAWEPLWGRGPTVQGPLRQREDRTLDLTSHPQVPPTPMDESSQAPWGCCCLRTPQGCLILFLPHSSGRPRLDKQQRSSRCQAHQSTATASQARQHPAALFLTDAGKRPERSGIWTQWGMRVLTRPAKTHPIVRRVLVPRPAMVLRFPIYPPPRYLGASEPVKRPKVSRPGGERVVGAAEQPG